ncbi:MAG: beta-ketoacyl synthase chain length factor [Treponema sp.]|nr:beta-ketoacyl synthase chain length factor [Treponema sp.]
MNEYADGDTYITRLSAWAPGITASGEWDEWAHGKRNILYEQKAPELSYTDSAFRRRLSQISRMTIQVIHDLLPVDENTKILFFSFRGELAREYQIFKMYTEEGELSPAAFSLSGFNTPAALACIAFSLKGGYSAMYPAKNSFLACIKAAQSALHSGKAKDIVLVYADENIPPDCEFFFTGKPAPTAKFPVPAAFGILLSRNSQTQSVSLSSLNAEEDSPLSFLKRILLCGKIHVTC